MWWSILINSIDSYFIDEFLEFKACKFILIWYYGPYLLYFFENLAIILHVIV